ncbi:MAG: dipeptidase E [Candidatus Saccharimonadales bacterium]|jgi:dipeptidase E
MKLVLCSEGFATQNTVDACVELVGKPQDQIKVGIINEAYAVELGDKRWVLDNLNSVAKHFPAEIDIISLLALSIDEIEKRLADKDVVFVVGGNTDYLMYVFNKSGFSKLLPKLLVNKVYVGSSAGSMVIGRRISTEAYEKVYGESGDYELSGYLNFVNLAIKPHFDSDDFPNNRAEILNKYASGTDFPVYGIRDDSAIVVNGDKQEFIGSKPHKVKRED